MRPKILYPLFSELKYLKGVGPKLSDKFSKLCGNRVIDLLFHRPTGLIDRSHMPKIAESKNEEIASIEVEIVEHKAPSNKYARSQPHRVICRDGSGIINVIYFNAKPDWIKSSMPVGEKRIISGRVEFKGDKTQMLHPDYVVKTSEKNKIARLEPTYPLTAGISQRIIHNCIEQITPKIPELPEWSEHNKISWKDSITQLHNPQKNQTEEFYERLVYDEFLASQLAQALVYSRATKTPGEEIALDQDFIDQIKNSLGFDLTGGQQSALKYIFEDMSSSHRMFRLIQGDVGCGKTAVALLAMATAAKNKTQAVFMAPTTLLAYQQQRWLDSILSQFGIKTATLTGNEKGKKREEILQQLEAGEIDILVGTHALFQDWVKFKKLGLVVIDEQHRFGVLQRLKLTQKNPKAHILLMTATPIPRSLTIAYYGEMDISKITEKPKNRLPVQTLVKPISKLPEIAEGMHRAIQNNEKIYWVCPLVEESAKSDLAAATERAKEFTKTFGDKVALVHGKMKEDEKTKIVDEFKNGDKQILVATTVIEVGIDVPDASIIFIEHADRFGLSQLHQLRGRVGRGSKQSTCVLLYADKLSQTAIERLKIMRENHDGFKIAEEDLKIRGSGDILGTKQSGLPNFKFATLPDNYHLLEQAREEAREIIKSDPQLKTEKGKNLQILLNLFEYDETIEYISAG